MNKVLYPYITKICNINCPKCFLSEENRKSNKHTMPEKYVRKALDTDIFKKAEKPLVAWTGGEITTLTEKQLTSYWNTAKEVVPHIRQTAITNLWRTPDWFVDFVVEKYESKIDTTFALGDKYSWAGSKSDYLTRFAKNFKKVSKAGIECYINLELNKPTADQPAIELFNYFNEIDAKIVNIDFSVDFLAFIKDPRYTVGNYPLLKSTARYADVAKYLIELFDLYISRPRSFKMDFFENILNNEPQTFFSKQERYGISVDSYGNVTTNPLFIDAKETHLGNLDDNTMDEILSTPKRMKRLRYESLCKTSCLSCEYYSLCGGGSDSLPTEDGSGECLGCKSLYKHIDKYKNKQ